MAATEFPCELCKVTYAADNELQDHNWSLMHHIKIEKIKKGAPHSCNLCMESCTNLIEYGKHLNEDRHKLALSRRAKEGTEILDSFSSQNDLFNNDVDDNPIRDQSYQGHRGQHAGHRGQQEFKDNRRSVNKHSRSFSQPELFRQERPDRQYQSQQNSSFFNGKFWQPAEPENPALFKKPRGRGGHSRKQQNDWRYNQVYGQAEQFQQQQFHQQHQQQFHNDNYEDINWNDNNFYNDNRYNPYTWNRNEPPERSRKGSFDSNMYRTVIEEQNRMSNRYQGDSSQDRSQDRGRRLLRSQRGRGRAHSYDNISPESTSSSDSGLKRRLENEDRPDSGKSRRKYSPQPFSTATDPSSRSADNSFLNDSRYMPAGDNERRGRSRSSSRDPYTSDSMHRSRVESIERPSSRNSDKKVSWSDQQQVSSTTDSLTEELYTSNHSGSGRNKQRSQLSKKQIFPDSSSESESSKGQKLKTRNKKQNNGKSSPKLQRKSQLGNDQTETVLEKAEKLCKKLRNDRLKAKQKKQADEKVKKFEKHREINEKLESLKDRSNQHITGVLEAQMSYMSGGKDSALDTYRPGRRTEDPDLSMLSSAPSSTYSDIEVAQLIPERLTSTPKPTPSVSSVSSQDSAKNVSSPSNISQRISQTKADIDAIRAKIESSVNKGHPTPTSSETTASPGRHLADLSSPGGRYSQNAERNSLRKMVNSPRTTKERLQLAGMLREHAKSQKKLSLTRFNLKYSDLCNDSDRQDEQVLNIDTLAPSVQLEIANIIEADVKPDIAELEKLLDLACAGNCELDANILTDLGVTPASPFGNSANHTTATVSLPIMISPEVSTRKSDTRSSDLYSAHVERTHREEPTETSRPKRSFLSENELLCQKDNPSRKAPSPRTVSNDLTTFGEWPGLSMSATPDRGAETSNSPEIRTWKPSEQRPKSSHDEEQSYGLSFDDLRSEGTYGLQKQGKEKRPTDAHLSGNDRFSSSLPATSRGASNSRTVSSSVHAASSGMSNSAAYSGMSNSAAPSSVSDSAASRGVSNSRTSSATVQADPCGASNSKNLPSSVHGLDPMIKIKQEKHDAGYDQAISSALTRAKDYFKKPHPHADEGVTLSGSDTATEDTVGAGRDAGLESTDRRYDAMGTGRFSPVRKSVHTQKLYGNDDVPVRDRYSSPTQLHENDSRSTLEKVTSILDGAPAPRVETGSKSVSTNASAKVPVDNTQDEVKDKHLDSSQHSQSSILDEIYNVSVSEESVRQEISTVDIKISKLKSLIEEAAQELNKCAEQKSTLMEQEQTYRTKRLKLLEESRSSSACSQASANIFSAENLSRIRDENPVLLKFLLSQRHSDLSSVGGYSNVETGSQPDTPRDSDRRASWTSNVSEPVSLPAEPPGPIDTNTLFSQSIDALSGSSESLMSVYIKQQNADKKADSGGEVTNPGVDGSVTEAKGDSINASNSISVLKNPLDKVGFVTLDALMKGDTDIGKLLNKSITSIEKGTIPEGASPLLKQSSNESAATGSTISGIRERRDSTFSIDTGSDSEKKSLSLKYMGTLPEGTDYESLVRQVSMDNKNKSVMFTVFSSPEAMTQLRKNPDAGSTPVVRTGGDNSGAQGGYKSDESAKTSSTRTLTHYSDVESQSVKSGYSLGEQIKRICDEQGGEQTMEVDMSKPTDELTGILYNGIDLSTSRTSPVKDCFVSLDRVDSPTGSSPKTLQFETQSPVRKRLKSKKERDQLSRRKQKENFILQSDTNSEAEFDANRSRFTPTMSTTKSEDDMVMTGSEDRTPRTAAGPEDRTPHVSVCSEDRTSQISVASQDRTPQLPANTDHQRPPLPAVSEVKRSLLDEVQLETETHSDSGDDSQKHSLVQYKGPPLSVACIQQFKGDLYVCYNGSELRRFDLKTGRILKELDCSPYLVNCLHVTSVDDVGDVLYTGGTCKKLMVFEPQKFNLITTYDYMDRITCLHEDWGRLFTGFSDGSISVRSLKSDKELNNFSCTTSSIHSVRSTSAGMTKMLCLATADKVIYVLDAITGLLITMLEGHTQPPLCLQISGDRVISGGTDHSLMIHSSTSGELVKMCMGSEAVTYVWYDGGTIYTASCDNIVRTYNFDLKPGEALRGCGKSVITCGITYDRMVILGKRDGSVEALPMDKVNKWSCKFGTCSLQFSVFHHFKLHVMSEHLDKPYCSYMNCSHTFTKTEDKQKHVLQHILSR